MSILKASLLICSLLFLLKEFAFCNDSIRSELWELDNLNEIAGHKVSYTGSPVVVQTDLGPAIRFNGVKDKVLIDANPIGDAKAFTVEMVFNADPAYATNKEPRFMHIQDPSDPAQKRVMMELRLSASNQVYLDGFMNTDNSKLTLIDEKLLHSSGVWNHVALTYANDTLSTWFNGKKELQGRVSYSKAILNATGKTSLGARMDDRNYFKGMIKAIRVTRSKIGPDQFFYLDKLTSKQTHKTLDQFDFHVSTTNSELIVALNKNSKMKEEAWLEVFNSIGQRLYRSKLQDQSSVSVPFHSLGNPKGLMLVKLLFPGREIARKVQL